MKGVEKVCETFTHYVEEYKFMQDGQTAEWPHRMAGEMDTHQFIDPYLTHLN